MEIVSALRNYQSVFNKAIFDIKNMDPQKNLDVAVIDPDTSDALGRKRFTGQMEYSVNVSPHIAYRFEVKPILSGKFNITEAAKRTASVAIMANGTLSESYVLTAGSVDSEPLVVLSESPGLRTIAVGEVDEFSLFAEGKTVYAKAILTGPEMWSMLETPSMKASSQMCVVNVDTIDIELRLVRELDSRIEDYDHIKIELYGDNKKIGEIDYILNQPKTKKTRLCWINKFGAIDYYSFVESLKDSLKIERTETILNGVINKRVAKINTQLELLSGFETKKGLKWLSGVACSPKVWLVNGQELVPITVESDTVEFKQETMGRVAISVSKEQVTSIQNY